MAKQTVNLGTMADNKSGDPLRTAFQKINENFTELYNANSGGGDLSAVSQSIIPDTDVAYDLGSSTKRFRDLFLSGNTIDLAGTKISATNGSIKFSGSVKLNSTQQGVIGFAGDGDSVVDEVEFTPQSGAPSWQYNAPLNGPYPGGVTIGDAQKSSNGVLATGSAVYTPILDDNDYLIGITLTSGGAGYNIPIEGNGDFIYAYANNVPNNVFVNYIQFVTNSFDATGTFTATGTIGSETISINYTVTPATYPNPDVTRDVVINSYTLSNGINHSDVLSAVNWYIDPNDPTALVQAQSSDYTKMLVMVTWTNETTVPAMTVVGEVETEGEDIGEIPTDINQLTDVDNLLGGGTTPITELPEWLTVVATNHLPTRNVDYGWDSNGVWTTNSTITDGVEGTSYPIRYNGSVPATQGVVITTDFVVNDLGADFGIGVWETGTDPIWQWGMFSGGNRIGAQYNGEVPELYGIVGNGVGSNSIVLLQGQTYTARLTLTPPTDGFITVTLETIQGENVLDTITYQEQAFTTSYSIGFASDQDDGTNRTYMKNLTININNSQQPLTDTLTSYNSGAPVEPVTGVYAFSGGNATVHNRDMNLKTTRDDWGTDADISIDSADDVWIDARGDMVRITAATTVELTANTSNMSNSTWYTSGDFVSGIWDGTTITLTVNNGNTGLTDELAVYLNGTFDFWFKTAGGMYQTTTSGNVTVQDVDVNKVYTIPVNQTSPTPEIVVTIIKLVAGATYAGEKTVTLREDGSIQLPSGSVLAYEDQQTISNGITIQASDLAGATIGWGAPVINSDNIVTNGWDYVSFVNETWYNYLSGLLGGQSGGVNVTWADGSTEIQSSIFVQFTDVNTFQFVPSADAGGSNIAGTWYFPLTIGSSTIIPAAETQTVNGKKWRYGANGNTELPGALIESVSSLPAFDGDRIQLDLTKSIQKLGEGEYGLANGVEGQVMQLVMVNNANMNNIAVWVDNARANNANGTNWLMLPFRRWDNNIGDFAFTDGICTLIFTDGAWQATGAVWD